MPARSRFATYYFRVRRGWSTAPHTLDLSSDGARVAVIRLWDKGKAVAGSFASEAELREAMGTYRRHIKELRDKGWLDGLDIHDWEKDQADGDPTAAERQRKARAKIAARHAQVTPNITPAVTDMSPPLTRTHTHTQTEPPISPPPEKPRSPEAAKRSVAANQVNENLKSHGITNAWASVVQLVISSGYHPIAVIESVREAREKYGIKSSYAAYVTKARHDGSSLISRCQVHVEEAEHAERKPHRDAGDKGGVGSLADMLSQVAG